MKLLEVLPLLEARKNPEQNPKTSAYQQLLKYKDNPNVYISMTTVPKLGLNPLSKWDTPLGIYCYPLQAVWDVYKFDMYKSLDKLPFVGTAPYIQVLEWNGKGKLLDVAGYNETDLKNDIRQLWNIYDDYPDTISIAIEEARAEHKDNIPAKVFFKICLSLSGREKGSVEKEVWDSRTKKTVKEVTFSKGGRKWNSLLRKLGYAGFSDKTGEGVIHPNEPIQAFFVSMEYVNQLEQIENKDYAGNKPIWLPRMVLGGNATNVVINGNQEIVIAPAVTRKQSMTYQQAVEYCKNLKIGGYGDWRLPTTNELLKLAQDYHVKYNLKLHGMYWAYNQEGTIADALEGVQFYDDGIVRYYGSTDKINVLAIKTRPVKW
jgi:hypothetical protein